MGTEFPWRWGRGTISANLDVIWGMSVESIVTIFIEGDHRVIRANSIPSHAVGMFPNEDNPHAIAEQNLTFSLPLTPTMLTTPPYPILGEMGVAVNGIVFNPTPAEWYLGRVRLAVAV